MIEPTYEAVDPETGEELRSTQNKLMIDALTPKTPLQIKVLAVSGNKRFANVPDRSRWRKLEKKATGAGPDQRLFYAWLENCIAWGMKKGGRLPYTAVISFAENEVSAQNWIIANCSRILKKKSIGEVKEVLEAKEKELDELYNED